MELLLPDLVQLIRLRQICWLIVNGKIYFAAGELEHRHVPRPARNLQTVGKLAQSSQELKRPSPVMHLHAGKTGDNGA